MGGSSPASTPTTDTTPHAPRRALRVGVLAALFLLAALVARLLLSGWAVDPDSLFHLTSGRWIVQHRAIPNTDVLSWYGQMHSTRWLPHEWLFDVLLYLVWAALGFQGVFAATSALFGGAVLCARRFAELRGASWVASLAVAVVALLGMARFISPRPGVATFLLLPLLAILLEKERWAPALGLFVLGMNLHGGAYPIYLLVFLYYGIPRRTWLVLAAGLLTLAQPLGFAVLKYPFFTLTPTARYIHEFQPTAIGSSYVFFAVLAVSWLVLDRRLTEKRDLVAAAALITLSLLSARTQPYFYLLALPLLAPAARLPRRERRERVDHEFAGLLEPRRSSANPGRIDAVALGVLLGCVVLVGARIPTSAIDVDRGYPRAALEYIKAHDIDRFWNEWNDGGYIMFKGVAPFVDGRLDPFDSFFNPDTSVALEYMQTYRRDNDIRPFLRKYGIGHLVVHRSTGLYQVLAQSRDFRTVHEDAVASVFEFVPQGK